MELLKHTNPPAGLAIILLRCSMSRSQDPINARLAQLLNQLTRQSSPNRRPANRRQSSPNRRPATRRPNTRPYIRWEPSPPRQRSPSPQRNSRQNYLANLASLPSPPKTKSLRNMPLEEKMRAMRQLLLARKRQAAREHEERQLRILALKFPSVRGRVT